MTTYLSPHFSLEELTATDHHGIDNAAPTNIVPVLTETANRMEEVRTVLGFPIHVNSGYRCPALNKAVGGARTSAHMSGHACDFICPGFGDPPDICRTLNDSDISFDQIIEEGAWVHISFDPRMRHQVLTKAPGGGYAMGLTT